MSQLIKQLCIILADTYTLYLKTQNYHWHVKGVTFKTLHELFEMQYKTLAEEVDLIAERIIMKGHPAPATFEAFQQLRTLKEGDSSFSANEMLADLANDQSLLIEQFEKAIEVAENLRDEASTTLLSDRIVAHEKMRWMLNASREEG